MARRTQGRSGMALMPTIAVSLLLAAAGLALAALELDAQILMRLRHPDDPAQALGPIWLQQSIRDITALGSNTVLAVVLLLAALMLGLLGKARLAIGVAVSAAAALAVVNLLKIAFGRDRPDVLSELPVLSASFPSSHAMMSATIYLMLGLIVAEALERPAVRRAAVATALAVVFATGLSRIYLGLHWPSDVLAGWALGLVWVVVSSHAFSALAVRG
jgi:undecaprenyl-diphosphatase